MADVRAAEAGKVYLVGAGPGDPELLTRRALGLLETADLVLHDDLVPEDILALAGAKTLVVSVGKRCGNRQRARQEDIHVLMADSARRGLSVVRLKSGDPMIFGRAGEEIEALRQAKIPFEVVPGITSALAAAAALEVSLTNRNSASIVEFSTGHRCGGGARGTTEPAGRTRVVYMPGRELAQLAASWLEAGETRDLPCCVISKVAQKEQSARWTTLGELSSLTPLPAPSLVLAGQALAERMRGEAGPDRHAAPGLRSGEDALEKRLERGGCDE